MASSDLDREQIAEILALLDHGDNIRWREYLAKAEKFISWHQYMTSRALYFGSRMTKPNEVDENAA